MKHWLWCLGVAAAAHATPAPAQAPHMHQHKAPAPAGAKAAETKAPAKTAAPAKAEPGKSRGYASAFADYRPFNPEEPMKNWRETNEEVRAAGGHIGILKAQEQGARP